jgi:putative peptidoglycan lipid II flippase
MSLAATKLLAGNLIVTLFNLMRDIEIARTLGTSATADNFFLALSLPIFLVTLSSGSYRMVVIPFLMRANLAVAGATQYPARRLNWLNLLGIAAISTVCAAAFGVAYFFVDGAQQSHLILLMLAVLPMYALAAFTELSQGALQVFGSLVAPNLARAALPAGIVLGAIWLGSSTGAAGLVTGGTFGALVGAIATALQLSRHGAPLRRTPVGLQPSEAHAFLGNFRAMIVASAVLALVPLIGQWLAALLGPGAVSALGYANRLTVGVASLVSGAVVPVLLSAFAHEAGTGGSADRSFFRTTIPFAWLGCGMTLLFWEFSASLIPLIYEHGQLTRSDARIVTLVANCFALQFPFLLASTTTTSLISALGLNRVFILINSIMLVTNITLTIGLMRPIGTAGVALASSLTYAVSLGLQFFALRRHGAIRIDFETLRSLMMPFGLLAIASLPVFLAGCRFARDSSYDRIAGSAVILLTFFSFAVVSNRLFVRRALAGLRG